MSKSRRRNRDRFAHFKLHSAKPSQAQGRQEQRKPTRYHYPRSLLDQPHFTIPATGKASIYLGMLANTTHYTSPLMALLNQLRSDDHDVSAPLDEAIAMRTILQQVAKDIEEIRSITLNATCRRVG